MNDKYENLIGDARPSKFGWWLIIAGFGCFLTWAWLAPLDSGVGASGVVTVTGSRKVVQPVTGGKIAAILAKDGDIVDAGQELVLIENTQPRSQLEIAKVQWFSSLATQSRLKSEQMGHTTIHFAPKLAEYANDPRVSAAMALQQELFQSRKGSLTSEISALNESLKGVELQTNGMEASLATKNSQLMILKSQFSAQKQLAEEGYIALNRVLDLQRTIASIEGAISEDIGNIGRGKQTAAEIKTRIVVLQKEFRKEVEVQLAEIEKESTALSSRLMALELDVSNTTIKSPARGFVMGLSIHTVGGVAAAGAPMMEIVPLNETLQIEAQIPPHLIDKVKPGLLVENRFTALNQATTPRVPGAVVHVSADAFTDPKQNQSFFKATVELTAEGVTALAKNDIKAGMPVEVFIKTGERKAWSYFVKPLTDRIHGALSEP